MAKKAPKGFNLKVTRSTVTDAAGHTATDVPGHPVAASCTIDYCQYFDLRCRLRELQADRDESDQVRERLSTLLDASAVAVNGPEPPLTKWSFHDIPEKVAALKQVVDDLCAYLSDDEDVAKPEELLARVTDLNNRRVAAIEAREQQRHVLTQIMQVLGPASVCQCQGCAYETNEAIRLLTTLGIEYQLRKKRLSRPAHDPVAERRGNEVKPDADA
jgi:hypothetical protein